VKFAFEYLILKSELNQAKFIKDYEFLPRILTGSIEILPGYLVFLYNIFIK